MLSLVTVLVGRKKMSLLTNDLTLSEEQIAHVKQSYESSRQSEKNSHTYPRKKRKRQTGEPNIKPINDELQTLANNMLS